MAPSYILAVMGVTGAGKSSFIKLVTGDSSIKIGHSQESETKSISRHEVYIRGRNFTLVDTPGFDDDDLTDSDVLKMLVDWLAATYRSGQKLSGILYLHRITDTRMRGSSLRNLKMFKELIGDEFHKNLTLGTTCWSLVSFNIALDRENELKTDSKFWKIMISKGARLVRILEDRPEARDLVYEIASHDAIPLQAQRDVVDRGISFGNLSVTRMVNYELEQIRQQQKAAIERFKEARQRRLDQEEEEMERELALIRARNERIEDYQMRQVFCQNVTPYGRCDSPGCYNKLRRWTATWHCCSCYSGDNYWQCGACGNDCGNDEHPAMSRIQNPDDDCVVM
ncbi:P-loop containing nucleoside triphosphate hydrolase protein [Hyaloscypha variabilis]